MAVRQVTVPCGRTGEPATAHRSSVRTYVIAPYAGGSMYSMRGLAECLVDDGEQAFLVQYPGRGPRARQPQAGSLTALADEVTADVLRHGRGRLVLRGHSLSGHVCFEVAHRCKADGWDVELLVISSARAPRFRSLRVADVLATTDAGRTAIMAGGSASDVPHSPELLGMAIEAPRSDHLLLARHPRRHDPVRCPVLLVGGDADRDVTAAHLRAWSELTTGGSQTVLLSGDHFYFRGHLAELRSTIGAHLSSLAPQTEEHA